MRDSQLLFAWPARAILTIVVVLTTAQSATAQRLAPEPNIFPRWQFGKNNDAADRVDFTVAQIDDLTDFHGDLSDPKLVLYVGGNYFFAMAPLVLTFEARLSQWKPKDFSARLAETPEALEQWLGVLVDAGADAFHLSQSKFWQPAFPEIDGELNLAGWAKKLAGVTAITVGAVDLSGDVYESFVGKSAQSAPLDGLLTQLERDEFDLIAVGRALLQDPAWLEKIRQGHVNQIADFTPAAFATLS
jgi:hypothetical protein